jgi:regulator of protease activity HflC (stomatin/prohibitin superfamily)
VYIQDVILPEKLVGVLTDREIANQEKLTYKMQMEAQEQRILTEKSKGTADMQAELAKSQVGIDIKTNNANARHAEGRGEAAYIEQTGKAQGAQVEAIGMARAKAYEAQVRALGQTQTAVVNVATVLSDGKAKFMPDVLVAGGGGSVEGLAATLIKYLEKGSGSQTAVPVQSKKM